MKLRKRRYLVLVMIAVVAAGSTAAIISFGGASANVPGQIDDGAQFLPQASITVDQAIAAAQKYQSGAIGEIDLETYQGKLVFNVDVGNSDVKVDAKDGSILGAVADD